MRILVVSNFYPPHHFGGYELGCYEAVEALRARGHDVAVLTSTHGVAAPQAEPGVYRWLDIKPRADGGPGIRDVLALARNSAAHPRALAQLCGQFRPDVLYLWNLTNLSLNLLLRANDLASPVCFYVFDLWPANLNRNPWMTLRGYEPRDRCLRLALKLASPLTSLLGLAPDPDDIPLRHVHFASRFLRDRCLEAGRKCGQTDVLPWGIDLAKYQFADKPHPPSRLLYVGQVVEHKGVHTAVRALQEIVRRPNCGGVTLTIAGPAPVPAYARKCQELVRELGLTSNARFLGQVARETLPAIYAQHDILLFPSIWDEPFGITLLEAMASGLAVVATATGGSAEIVRDGVNALVFAKDNAGSCANQIARLLEDRDLFLRIRATARRDVEEKFDITAVIDRIEQSLQAVVDRSKLHQQDRGAPEIHGVRVP